MLDLILASGSPRRKLLLEMLGLNFSVIPAEVDEPEPDGEEPATYAEYLAEMKAAHVADQQRSSVVVGADTIVVLGDVVLGKPKGKTQAVDMLASLSGCTHCVITGISLQKTDNHNNIIGKHSFHVTTQVTFSRLSQGEISKYIETGSPFDKAGGYGIQDDLGALFVERIDGCYYNVVGFPVNRFYNEMKSFEPQIFQHLSPNTL